MYAALDEDEYRRYARDYAEESTAMAGMIQRARDEGKREGRREGLHQGVERGERNVLERQLRHRFGLLPASVVERLGRASSDQMEAWADNVLDAETLDEVFEPRS